MIKININEKEFDMEGTVEETISEAAFAIASICIAGISEETNATEQEQAEAVVFSACKAVKRWLNELTDKDIDLEKIGRCLQTIK